MIGRRCGGVLPSISSISVWQTPHAETLTSSFRRGSFGTGKWTSERGFGFDARVVREWRTIAFIIMAHTMCHMNIRRKYGELDVEMQEPLYGRSLQKCSDNVTPCPIGEMFGLKVTLGELSFSESLRGKPSGCEAIMPNS